MNTPKNGREQRLTRAHTPRMSDRKKQLFGKPNEDDDICKDLMPLSRANSLIRVESTNNLPQLMSPNHHMLIQNSNDILVNTPTRHSPRLMSNDMTITQTTSKHQQDKLLQLFTTNDGKENLPLEMTNIEHVGDSTEVEEETEELHRIFNNSCNVSEPLAPEHEPKTAPATTSQNDNNNNNNNSNKKISDNYNLLNISLAQKTAVSHCMQTQKRTHNEALMLEDRPNCAKIARDSISNEPIYISPKSFYSRTQTLISPINSKPRSKRGKSLPPMTTVTVQRAAVSRNRRTPKVHKIINKGVQHKVRRSMDTTRQHMTAVSVDRIISNIRNERLRQLVMDKRAERAKIEEVHNILRNVRNPIEMARPLSVLGEIDNSLRSVTTLSSRDDDSNNNNNKHKNNELFRTNKTYDNNNIIMECDFSDCEIESDDNSDAQTDIIEKEKLATIDTQLDDDEDEIPDNIPKRKFFKTGHNVNTKKEIKLFENVKASVFKGKISLITKPKKVKRYKLSTANNISFSQEQATVDAILANLDDMSFVEKQTMKTTTTKKPLTSSSSIVENPAQIMQCNRPINVDKDSQLKLYEHYSNLIPYKTNDPDLIEQQTTLLYFLYSNNICTEENFKIFIAELEQHKEEASRIVEEVVSNMQDNDMLEEIGVLQNNDQCHRELTKSPDLILSTKDPTPPGSPIIGLQNSSVQYYPVFYAEHRQNVNNMNISSNTPYLQLTTRNWRRGEGGNQRQIDAGQREFGARECKQCGLVYTMHEPEEEKLHRQFHDSQHVQRFKGWIDEDVVGTYAEWSNDGRILRLTENAPVKRRERLKEILALVDMELGFASYIMPKTFVAFLAVRKQQIVGVCLVQPLSKASKYICCNGTDCCSIEEYDAKCGISRIWVSPLHRRLNIATKLLEAVQRNIIPHEEITRDKIAFSAPTHQGRLFAQRFTGLTDFLVYQ